MTRYTVDDPPKVGDKVRFELRVASDCVPRWYYGNDCGGSGIFHEGKVIYASSLDTHFTIEYQYDVLRHPTTWRWPLDFYHNRPGWIEKIDDAGPAQQAPLSSPEQPKPAYQESMEFWGSDFLSSQEARIIDAGERACRRIHTWPSGMKLKMKMDEEHLGLFTVGKRLAPKYKRTYTWNWVPDPNFPLF